jgi:hypothetical protein
MKANVDIELDPAELMSAVFDNLWRESSSWVFKIRWDFTNPLARKVAVCYENPTAAHDAPKCEQWKYTHVGPEDLIRGFELMIKAGQHHCGELIPIDLDDWDACCSDECLQYTIFGESIYG